MVSPQTCPICNKPVASYEPELGGNRFFPFCTLRCQQVDLLRWSKGQYKIVENLTPEKLQDAMEELGAVDGESYEGE